MTLAEMLAEIPKLSEAEQRALLEHLARTLAAPAPTPTRSLLELEGLGAELWHGQDAQELVARLRDEWDARP